MLRRDPARTRLGHPPRTRGESDLGRAERGGDECGEGLHEDGLDPLESLVRHVATGERPLHPGMQPDSARTRGGPAAPRRCERSSPAWGWSATSGTPKPTRSGRQDHRAAAAARPLDPERPRSRAPIPRALSPTAGGYSTRTTRTTSRRAPAVTRAKYTPALTRDALGVQITSCAPAPCSPSNAVCTRWPERS